MESRDGGAARKILVAGLLGTAFSVSEAWRRRRAEGGGDEEDTHPKAKDLDSDSDDGESGGGDGGEGAAGVEQRTAAEPAGDVEEGLEVRTPRLYG